MIILKDGKRCPVCRPNRKLTYEETANTLQKITQEYNINLLRIPYTEFSNIEAILNKTLDYFNNTNGKTFNEFINSLQLKIPTIEGVKNDNEQFCTVCN